MKPRFVRATFCLLLFASCTKAAPQADPVRVDIVVDDTGYRPKAISAKAGVPLTLVVKRTSENDCYSVFTVPSEKLEKALPLNQPVEVTFTPQAKGQIDFMCGMKMISGTISVD